MARPNNVITFARASLTRLLTGAGLVVEGDETLDELREAVAYLEASRGQ